METFDNITINLIEDNLLLLNILMAFIMFGIALDMKWSDFTRVFSMPKKVLIGLSSQWILLPLLTLLILILWSPHPSIAIGLLLIASVPGGIISNFTVHLGRGNTALSVTLTTIVTLGAIISTPVIFTGLSEFWLSFSDSPVTETYVRVPFGKILEIITVLILIPLVVGIFLADRFPAFIDKVKKPVRIISLIIFFAFIVGAIYENMDNIFTHLEHVFWLVIIHNLAALLMGYSYARYVWSMDRADCKAISIETGIQNGGLGLILIFNFFPDMGGMALVAAWWGVWDMISALLLGLYWNKFSQHVKN